MLMYLMMDFFWFSTSHFSLRKKAFQKVLRMQELYDSITFQVNVVVLGHILDT